MLRKVSSVPWQNLSLLKLREELSTRGLMRLSSKEDMIRKLQEYEENREKLSILKESQEPVENTLHNHLPVDFIYDEIIKRDPDFSLSSSHTKASLLTSLKMILIDERGLGRKDLRNLMKLSKSSEPLHLKEIVSVLDQIQDPSCLSQIDFNILLHTESNSLFNIWEFIKSQITSMDFSQIKSTLAALNTLQNFFQKDFLPNENRVSFQTLNQFLTQACNRVDEASPSEIASLLLAAESLVKEKNVDLIQKLREKMIEKFDLDEVYDDSSLVKMIINLPTGCANIQGKKVDKMIQGIKHLYSSFSYQQLIHILFGIHRSGKKLSFEFSQNLETMQMEGMKKIPAKDLLEFSDTLISQGLMSENLAMNIVEALSYLSAYDRESSEELIDFIFKFYESGLSNLLLSRLRAFLKINNFGGEISFRHLLKFGIMYWPHVTDQNYMMKVLLSVVDNKEKFSQTAENFDLITELQKILLDDEKEKPIFNYQFNSFYNINVDAKDRCIQNLQFMIQSHDASHLLIFEYFSEYKNAKIPTSEEILEKSTFSNFNKLCKSIWRFGLNELALSVFNSSLELLDGSEGDFTEGLYYLTSLDPEISPKVNPRWSKPGVFYLALNYNLSLPINSESILLDTLNENLVLFGEPLLKTLIRLSEKNKTFNIFRLTSNLSFTPSTHRCSSRSLISSFFKQMQVHQSPVDHLACSIFLSSKIKEFDKDDLISLFSFFKSHWNVLSPELQIFFETNLKTEELFEVLGQGLSPVSIPKVMQMQSSEGLSYKNSNIIENLTKYNVYNDNIVNSYISLISILEPEQALVVVSRLLELFSVTSCRKIHFEALCASIAKKNLWNSLSHESCINFFVNFHHLKSVKVKLPENFEEKFKFNLLKLDHSEELFEHPVVKLLSYKSFKYLTEFVPRSIVSNSQQLREISAEVSTEIDIPESEVLKSLKKYSLLVQYGISPSEEMIRTINNYYKQKDRNIMIRSIKSELLELVQENLGYKVYSQEHDSQNTSSFLWKYDLGFSMSSQVFLIVPNSDYCYMPDGSLFAVSLMNKIMKTQMQEKMKLKVAIITCETWNKLDEEEKKKIAALVGENLKSNNQ